MSRMTTPQTAQPTSPVKVPHDKIAMRAYEKWVKKGRPLGSAEQDWLEAETELKGEFGRGVTPPMPTPTSTPTSTPTTSHRR